MNAGVEASHKQIAILSLRVPERKPINYNNVADISYGLFGTDGVALEAQKVDGCLATQHGKNIFWIAGDVPSSIRSQNGLQLGLLDYKRNPKIKKINERLFPVLFDRDEPEITSEENVMSEIFHLSTLIKKQLTEYMKKNGIGVFHIRNMFSLPLCLPATLALREIIEEYPEVQFILHHHDFIWEGREDLYLSPFENVDKILSENFPPKKNYSNVKHITINTEAKSRLESMGLNNVTVIPDSFPFGSHLLTDEEVVNTRKKIFPPLGIKENDLVLGVMTRIIPRKNIEVTIQLAATINKILKTKNDSKFGRAVLFVAQKEDRTNPLNIRYFEALSAYAKESGVKLVLAGSRVGNSNGITRYGNPIYPFYSVFQLVDGVVYPSRQEGFGNQLLEAINASKPLALLEYPVFQTDIKPYLESRYVSLGDPGHLIATSMHHGTLNLLPPEDIEKYAREYLDLISYTKKSADFGQLNFTAFKEHLDTEVVTGRLLEAFPRQI
ncbi:MAG: Glycosyl transferase group 1 [Candidatus Roizmanbacteria bacterium GW2011_GWA2_35_19]|uniref:Glycosyl transferase group 1 n=1 Tax=Candidatus Roizmanbacteria bacterium GW2011_GWA2_35_19 TaxID=1618478 RepID=A0A0G0BS27_9BACT|nr:MAG: Glycosyl transferase group 1 [Candidatus Roizmanbacteria bacterium GW2011_GWA2_35_19]